MHVFVYHHPEAFLLAMHTFPGDPHMLMTISNRIIYAFFHGFLTKNLSNNMCTIPWDPLH